MKLTERIKNQLWRLIIGVDYDASRIRIADYELQAECLVLWLEDVNDFKNSLDECLQLEVPVRQFAKVIKTENLNSYEGSKMHPTKNFVYKTRIVISEPMNWYTEDASPIEQQWAREAVLKNVLTHLIENEVYDGDGEW